MAWVLNCHMDVESQDGDPVGEHWKMEDPRIKIQAFYLFHSDNEKNLKLAVALIGPISVSIRVTKKFL